jgi:xanthine dehydrogenase accessory factor
MRKLSELIVLVRGGGEVGSAIAYRLSRCHFRVCITEIASPLAISRGVSFSEAIYDTTKMVEDLTAERTLPSLEHIYRVWRAGKIPIIVDPELNVKPLIKPDVLINAMMLKRQTNTRITDAPLVIGIGPGFTAGSDVHLVIESHFGINLGDIVFEGESEKTSENPQLMEEASILAEEAGVFITDKNIGDSVQAGDIIGSLNEAALQAPIAGVVRGILRNESRVLANISLAEIDPVNDKPACFILRNNMKIVSAGVLEAILMTLNTAEMS